MNISSLLFLLVIVLSGLLINYTTKFSLNENNNEDLTMNFSDSDVNTLNNLIDNRFKLVENKL